MPPYHAHREFKEQSVCFVYVLQRRWQEVVTVSHWHRSALEEASQIAKVECVRQSVRHAEPNHRHSGAAVHVLGWL